MKWIGVVLLLVATSVVAQPDSAWSDWRGADKPAQKPAAQAARRLILKGVKVLHRTAAVRSEK